jgi:SP family arabinose:H+ symporter-like MFS transporter
MTHQPSRHALLFATSVAAMGGFLFGYDTAVINGANELLEEYFQLTSTQLGTATASAIIGCVPGAAIAGYLSDRYGRKKILYICALLFGLSAVLSALPYTLNQFLIARFIGGLGIGICSMVCPVYIAECAPAEKRGRLGTLFQFGIVFGIFITLFINLFIQSLGDLDWNTALGWRWMLGAEVIPAVAFLGLIAMSPESPRWLVMQGRRDQAKSILQRWLDNDKAESEIATIEETLNQETGRFSELFEKRFRKPLIAALGLMIIQQFCGINAIIYYSTRIFASAGAGIGDAFMSTVIVGFVNLLFTLVAISLVDKAGRRPLLIIGLGGQFLALSTVALLFGNGTGATFLLVAVLVFIASFAMSIGPIGWLFASEVFPGRIRGRAMSLASFTIWVSTFIVAQTFPMLNDGIGPANTFWIFAGVSLFGLFFVIRYVPETKGRTLEEIEQSW